MRTIRLALILLLAVVAGSRAAFAADGGRATIHAILIVASNESGPTDGKLAPYESTLRRVLRYQSFRAVGEGSASVAAGGSATVSLPHGNRVELSGDKAAGRGVAVKVRRGGTEVPVSPGKPVVLLGGSAGDKGEVYAIIVTAN